MKLPRIFLLVGGVLSLCAAALHVAFIIVPEWSSIFGEREESNRLLFQGVTLGVTILLLIWALYGFSGAGLIARLPLLRVGILLIGAIYISYALLAGARLLALVDFLPPSASLHIQDALVVIGALLAGTFYWLGLAIGWRRLGGHAATV